MNERTVTPRLPDYPPDSFEELLSEIRRTVLRNTGPLDGPRVGAIHNAFAIGLQTLHEMEHQRRYHGKEYAFLKEKQARDALIAGWFHKNVCAIYLGILTHVEGSNENPHDAEHQHPWPCETLAAAYAREQRSDVV